MLAERACMHGWRVEMVLVFSPQRPPASLAPRRATHQRCVGAHEQHHAQAGAVGAVFPRQAAWRGAGRRVDGAGGTGARRGGGAQLGAVDEPRLAASLLLGLLLRQTPTQRQAEQARARGRQQEWRPVAALRRRLCRRGHGCESTLEVREKRCGLRASGVECQKERVPTADKATLLVFRISFGGTASLKNNCQSAPRGRTRRGPPPPSFLGIRLSSANPLLLQPTFRYRIASAGRRPSGRPEVSCEMGSSVDALLAELLSDDVSYGLWVVVIWPRKAAQSVPCNTSDPCAAPPPLSPCPPACRRRTTISSCSNNNFQSPVRRRRRRRCRRRHEQECPHPASSALLSLTSGRHMPLAQTHKWACLKQRRSSPALQHRHQQARLTVR